MVQDLGDSAEAERVQCVTASLTTKSISTNSCAFSTKDKSLYHYSRICSLERANKLDVKALQEWLRLKDGGHYFLKGHEASTWSEDNEKDLISMMTKDEDTLSRWIDLYILPLFHKFLGQRVKVGPNFCSTPW